jgi:hypothetical protein
MAIPGRPQAEVKKTGERRRYCAQVNRIGLSHLQGVGMIAVGRRVIRSHPGGIE